MIVSAFIVILFKVFSVSSAETYEQGNDVDRFIIPCHSSDYVCFKKQFKYLRDLVLIGSEQLGVSQYHPYMFQYADTSTCVKMTGADSSQLVGIRFDGCNKTFSLTVAMPVRLQQIPANWTLPCQIPEREFKPQGSHTGPYKRVSCNATMVVHFPFALVKEGRRVYMAVENEDLDVVLDVPDLRTYNRNNALETKLFHASEWAYEMVQHVDVPDHVMVPFMHRLKTAYTRLPLDRFILLYPLEHYSDLIFEYNDEMRSGPEFVNNFSQEKLDVK